MAKDKILRWARIYVGPYNVSGDARTFSSLDNNADPVEMTGWSEEVKNFLAGYKNAGITGFQAFANDDTNKSFDILKDADVVNPVGILFGSQSEPDAGDAAYLMTTSIQLSSMMNFDGGAVVVSADFLPKADDSLGEDIRNPLGFTLHGEIQRSVTYNGATVDLGEQKTKGGHAILFVVATSGGTWSIKIQDSPDDSVWSDLITFSADGSIVTSEAASITGTVDQYVRAQLTRTSGDITPIILFAYNV